MRVMSQKTCQWMILMMAFGEIELLQKKFRQYFLKRDFLAIFPEAECYRMFGL